MKNLKKLLFLTLVFSWTIAWSGNVRLNETSTGKICFDNENGASELIVTNIYGVVTDCTTDLPIIGVTVSVSTMTVQTNDLGYYELPVDPGTYIIEFTKLGYETMVEVGVTVVEGIPYELNVCMYPTPYPVPWVYVDPLDYINYVCTVNWGVPEGAYEILYDDGSTDNYTNWSSPDGMVAVRFSPEGYPATITGGELDVGDGSFPVGGNFIGTDLKISVLDDDGSGGIPGTVLDEVVLTVDNYGWVSFPDVFNITIEEGDFYLAMTQLGAPDNSAPMGVDTDTPLALRSYEKAPGGNWLLKVDQDYMMRAYVFGSNNMTTTKSSSPNSVEAAQDGSRELSNYVIARIFNMSACNDPTTGTMVVIAYSAGVMYQDIGIFAYPPGFYVYAVKAVYSLGESEWTYSNVVGHLNDAEVTVNVVLCNGESPEGAEVIMTGFDCPYQSDTLLSDPTGVVVFDSIIFGNYQLNVSQVGYNPVMLDVNILDDTVIDVVLTQKLYPARNVVVDSVTNIVTWDEPVITALEVEGFEGTDFPPPGWQSATIGMGWFQDDNGGSTGFPVPPGDGYYAITNSDVNPGVDASLDYLITPNIDLRESPTFTLYFDHFFTMTNGEAAYVEYSLDAGATWDVLQTLSPVTSWTLEEVDLSAFSGLSGESNIWFAFHYTNNNNAASGWAVDNVSITNGPPFVLGYYIYLDQAFMAESAPDVRTHFLANLTFGQTYQVGISPVYPCAVAEPTLYSWTSGFLFPPRNMEDQYVDGSEEVPLKWNPPMEEVFKFKNNSDLVQDLTPPINGHGQTLPNNRDFEVPQGLINFKLYQDDMEFAQIPYEGQGVSDWIYDTVRGLDPGDYIFGVSAEYDLTSYGFPGDFGESLQDYTDTVHVAFGTTIPFDEGWDNGTFEFNGWQVSRSNWQITTIDGNPAPAAQFSGEPLLENDYSSTLTSYPMRADQLTEGVLYLDVDIRLDDKNATGLEMLDIDVFDGGSWHTVTTIANEGSFDYTTHHIDITEFGMSEILKIRFHAHGQHSNDLNSWFVDNIRLYRVCESVSDLQALEYNMDDALISWITPVVTTKTANRQVSGFNIYRKTDGMNDYELFDYYPSQPGQETYTYLDETTTIGMGYCYQVTCIWESETDYCESAPGYNVALTEDYVCLLITNVHNPTDEAITMYPNPAREKLTIVCSIPMRRITVMNYAGQVVYESLSMGDTHVVLNTTPYETGVYMVQITTDTGVATKRVVIAE